MATRDRQLTTGRRGKGNEAGDATRELLIRVAEKLFARRGIESVSIRDITAAAKVNTAAVHYHFGSKRDLVRAILDLRLTQLGQRRKRYLDTMDRERQLTIREIAAALVLPTAQLLADRRNGSRYYVGFVMSIITNPSLMDMVTGDLDRSSAQLLEAFKAATPELSEEDQLYRFALARYIVLHALHPGSVEAWLADKLPTSRSGDTTGSADATERLVDFLAGALRGS